MENPIIPIAAKFQFNIPSLRTLAVMDTISWSRGRLHRKSCTFPRRSWIRKVAIDVNTFFRPPLKNWCWKPFSGMLVLLFLLLSMMLLITWFTCPPTIHFKFTTNCDKCHCKVRQLFYCKVRRWLQSATEHTRASVYATDIPGPAITGLQTFTNWLEPIHIQLFYSRQRYHTLQRYSFKEVTREKGKQYVISHSVSWMFQRSGKVPMRIPHCTWT